MSKKVAKTLRFMRISVITVVSVLSLSGCSGGGGAVNKAQVTVIVDYRDNLMNLIDKFGEQSWCESGLTLMDTRGGQGITLKVEGEEQTFSGRLAASSGNGADLPCQFEAVLVDVPTGKTSYEIEQVGGQYPSLAAKIKLTGEELQAKGNIIIMMAP